MAYSQKRQWSRGCNIAGAIRLGVGTTRKPVTLDQLRALYGNPNMLTQDQIDSVIAEVLAQEGGYVDNPQDPGGRTNFGVTQTTADEYDLGDVANLTTATAIKFYREWFAEHKIDQIPDLPTFGLVADAMTNHGPGVAIKWLQEALNVTADGDIGPKTLTAIGHVASAHKGWQDIYADILVLRIRFYGELASKHPYNCQWINGWLRRACSFLSPWPEWS